VNKQLRYLRKFDPNLDASANWKEADLLRDAWFQYGPLELKERYRDSGRNPHLSKSLELDMKLSVRGSIEDGEILAFGVQIFPELKTEAEEIPAIFFQSRDARLDWESGRIFSFGREFHDVRICLSSQPETPPEKRTATVATKSRRGGGRPSQYSKIREVLQELFADHPAYQQFSAARLQKTVNERYLAKFAPPGESVAPISERSLREHLKTYRQELAETGNN
jgi:hypothetical protein